MVVKMATSRKKISAGWEINQYNFIKIYSEYVWLAIAGTSFVIKIE
jgi:hypothetical protein